jgi:hypothetical protein
MTEEREKSLRVVTTIEVERKILGDFRVAISKKYQGVTRGTTYIELNNALSAWTKVMNGEAEITVFEKKARAPVFTPEDRK